MVPWALLKLKKLHLNFVIIIPTVKYRGDFFMTIAFVLGNGVSRSGLPLEHIKTLGKVYGCNALYREFTPDVLVATDRPIAQLIQETGYSARHRFYTRKPIPGLGALRVPSEYYGFSSGPNAVGIAALNQHTRIYMIGFDMGPSVNNQFNNMYAGTEFYKTPDAKPTFTGNWVKQIKTIATDFPSVELVRVCGNTTARIPDLDAIKNMTHEDLTTFVMRINNQKDL
jgi:hypothetical protein